MKSIVKRFEAAETKTGIIKSLSVRDSARAQIRNAIFAVDYSRPLMRGRKLLGDLIPMSVYGVQEPMQQHNSQLHYQ